MCGGRQIINVLARPTNSAEQFCGQRKEANLSANISQNFALVCMRFLASTDSTSHDWSFVSIWWSSFCFDKTLKYLVYIKIFHEPKLKAFVKMQMTRNQPNTFQNRRIFRELNNVTLEEMPSTLIRLTLVLTCSLRVESLHTLFAMVLTGTSNNEVQSIESGIWWSADITPYSMRVELIW